MAIGDILRIDVNQNLQSSNLQNVLYYKINVEDTSGDDIKALALEFKSDVVDPIWRNLVAPDLQFTCLTVQKVFPTPVGAVQDFNVALPGVNGGESLPAMDAGLIQKFNPAVGGVGKKGRVYCAGIIEGQANDGRMTVDGFALLVLLAAAMEDTLEVTATDGEYEPVWVIKKPDDPNKGSITGFVEDLTFEALPRIATQRRRRTPIRATSF